MCDQWHTQRPTELNGLYVFTNDLAFSDRQSLQPIAHWFTTDMMVAKLGLPSPDKAL